MRIRNNDSDNDWIFGHSKSDYITGNAGVMLNLKSKINEWKQDCFFDLESGIDWKFRLGYKDQRDLLDEDIKDIINSIDEVLTITEFESYVDDRKYTCDFTIYTIYSEIAYSDTITLDEE